MGVRASCICDPSSRREVIVMKENGEFQRFRECIRVKDILAANPHHKVIRYCSADRNNDVLPDSFQLSCNQLYFLLPRGFFLTDETYQNMLRLAASSRNSNKSSAPISITDDQIQDTRNIPRPSNESNAKYNNKVVLCPKEHDDDGEGDRNGDGDTENNSGSRWKPALKTIPELNSPLPIAAVPSLDSGCLPEPIASMHGNSGYKQELVVTSIKRKQEVAFL